MQKYLPNLSVTSALLFAAIVGIAAPAHAKTSCGCKQQMNRLADELGGGGPTPRGSASPAAKALEPPTARPAASAPARRSLEIELNFFGRRYSVEVITTSEAQPAMQEHIAPAARPTPGLAPVALG